MGEGRLLSSEAWSRFLADKDINRQRAFVDELLARATAADVLDLVALVGDGTLAERECALRLLVAAGSEKMASLRQDERDQWISILRRLVSAEYPRLPLGPLALRALLQADRVTGEAFILSELDLSTLDDRGRMETVTDLRTLRGERVHARLREVVSLGGDAGKQAEDALEGWGIIARERIEMLAQEWRATHDRRTLNRLYHVYFNHLPGGTVPMEEIENLLGAPTRRSGEDLWYETKGACLFLEGVNGHLRGRKLN